MNIARTSSLLSLSDQGQGHCGSLSPFTTIQTVRSYSSTLGQARNLILSMYVHLILIYKIYECRHIKTARHEYSIDAVAKLQLKQN